jgi:hypothetical protein
MDMDDAQAEEIFDGAPGVSDSRNGNYHLELRKVDRIVSQAHGLNVLE